MIKFSILQNISLLRNLLLFPFYYLLKYIFNINHVIASSSVFKIVFPLSVTIVPSRIILQNDYRTRTPQTFTPGHISPVIYPQALTPWQIPPKTITPIIQYKIEVN